MKLYGSLVFLVAGFLCFCDTHVIEQLHTQRMPEKKCPATIRVDEIFVA